VVAARPWAAWARAAESGRAAAEARVNGAVGCASGHKIHKPLYDATTLRHTTRSAASYNVAS